MILGFHHAHVIGEIVNNKFTLDSDTEVDNPCMILRKSTRQEHKEYWRQWAMDHNKDFSGYINLDPFYYEVSVD